jgi:hypothetical protein
MLSERRHYPVNRIPDKECIITVGKGPTHASAKVFLTGSMENVWAYLWQNKLGAVVWNSYEEIIDACGKEWNWLIDDPARIRSIGTRQ